MNAVLIGAAAALLPAYDGSAALSRRAVFSRSLSLAAAVPTAALLLEPQRVSAASVAAEGGQKTASTEFISGLVAGGAQKTIKELVLHPLDTVKTRLQVVGSRRSLFELALYERAYDGILPALLSGAPAAATFFAVKDTIKQQATPQLGATLGTIAAVGGANGEHGHCARTSVRMCARLTIDIVCVRSRAFPYSRSALLARAQPDGGDQVAAAGRAD